MVRVETDMNQASDLDQDSFDHRNQMKNAIDKQGSVIKPSTVKLEDGKEQTPS